MTTQRIERGRLFDHVHLVVRDLAAARQFYAAVLEALGIPIGMESADFFSADELFVSTAASRAASGELTGRVHLAFQGQDRDQVVRAHAAGIAAGGKENGPPGERPYHPGYYAAFLLDPDGNNIEIVFHGPATASARSIVITWDAP